MKIAQSEQYEGQDWWRWSVWIDGRPDELDAVEKVVWHLHPTFPEPDRECKNREEKFRLETAGWGTFPIVADVVMKDGGKAELKHQLELHYPDRKSTEN